MHSKTSSNYAVISDSAGELRALSFQNNKPTESLIRRHHQKSPARHDVFIAKIEQWSPSMGGVFVSLGEKGRAFMPVSQDKKLKAGGLYPVIVTRAAVEDKLPRVSMDVVFVSARLMLIPSKPGIHLSHRAKNRAVQSGQMLVHRLKQEGFDNLLIRETALKAPIDLIIHEAKFMSERYKAYIEEVRLTTSPGPLKFASHYLDWFVADHILNSAIYISNQDLYNTLYDRWSQLCPDMASNIEMTDSSRADALIDEHMDSLLNPVIPLSSIGNCIIEHTHALTSIDINAFTGHRKTPHHHFNVNLSAISEIVRHIRLRHIGGPIIIDFLNMKEKNSHQAIEAEVRKLFESDYAQTDILPISSLGMMEMTREKCGPSLSQLFARQHDPCALSFETTLYKMARALFHYSSISSKKIIVNCAPSFYDWLQNKSYLSKKIFGSLYENLVLVKNSDTYQDELYDIIEEEHRAYSE